MKSTIALIVCAQMFSSCFGPKLVNKTEEGELAEGDSKLSDRDPANDDSFFDEYKFVADEGVVISVALNSDAFDAYLHLLGPSGKRLEDHDDIEEQQNTNASIRCIAPVKGTYAVIANSYEAGETGAYKLTYQTTKATDADADVALCGGADGAAAAAPSENDGPGDVQVVQ